MLSTTHAARVWDPKNRDRRPSLCGLFRIRIAVKVDDPEQHPDREQILDEPDERPVPDHRDRERPGKQIPYTSMIVKISTRKPQNVAACAAPGSDHFKSLRCPTT